MDVNLKLAPKLQNCHSCKLTMELVPRKLQHHDHTHQIKIIWSGPSSTVIIWSFMKKHLFVQKLLKEGTDR